MPGGGCYVGVDIGGTKIAAALVHDPAVVDPDGGGLHHKATVPTPRTGGGAVLAAVAALVAEVAGGAAITAVGVGAPGVIDARTGAVGSATDILPGWAGTAVRAELERLLGRPVAVENDVRAMARGEADCGAGQDFTDALFVSVGTGIGGALQRDGRLVRGPHGSAGELGHLLVPARGVLACGCGRHDHLEAVAAGPAIAAAYGPQTDGTVLTLPAVMALVRAGDPHAQRVLTEAATVLGRALAGVLSVIDADGLVIGGGVASIGVGFLGPLADALHAEVLAPLAELPVRAAELGTDAPLIGAALLARELQAVAA